jgi:hypothetical protein
LGARIIGCGNALVAHTQGSAFEEQPGHVHRIFNLGSDPVVVLRTDILPPCYENQGTIFVSGPDCEGNSGKSHLVPIAPCPSEASASGSMNLKGLVIEDSHVETTVAHLRPSKAEILAQMQLMTRASGLGLRRDLPDITGMHPAKSKLSEPAMSSRSEISSWTRD